MPKGALLTHTVEAVLHDLADSGATGCLLVRDQEGDEAEVYLRDGQVYAVNVPGRRVMLGVRLMSRGALTPEALAEALEIQRTELQGWRLGELLVHLGYVELDGGRGVRRRAPQGRPHRPAGLAGGRLEVPQEQEDPPGRRAADAGGRALRRPARTGRRPGRPSSPSTGGPDAVPALAAASPSDEVALGPNEWALLCKVDSARSVASWPASAGSRSSRPVRSSCACSTPDWSR